MTLAKSYFWRNSQQQEIDYVEEIGTNLMAFEFKWNPKKRAVISKTFTDNYEAAEMIVKQNNFRKFVRS